MRSHGSSLRGFFDNILQGWFKMKTTSIFPAHGTASLILMSKHAQSRQFFEGVFRQYFTRLVYGKMKTTSIFPAHGLASLILMSKHAQSQQFFEGVF